MLQNAYLLAKVGADTAENERNFTQILQEELATRSSGAPARARRPGPPRQVGRFDTGPPTLISQPNEQTL